MTMTRKWIGAFMLSAVGGVFAGPAWAQSGVESNTGQSTADRAGQPSSTAGAGATNGTAGRANTGQPATGSSASAHGDNLDQKIAVCLLLGNQEEVALAQFAEQHAQNEEVRQFAKQMIEHHQQAISQIQQAAPEAASLNLQLQGGAEGHAAAGASGVRTASAEESTASNRPGADSTNAGASRNSNSTAANGATSNSAGAGNAAAGGHAGHDQRAIQMAQQIKQECLNLTQQELSEKQGAEFDKAYMGQQVAAHLGMLAELRGSKNFASKQLQQVVSEGEQMTQKHLDQAKQIMSELKDQQGAQGQTPQTSQRPAATTRSAR
ncbi:MAG: DUF4142 domain-containing protein [Planctomycetaceae bacterium]|nr:DUF4142 domain-containing protein [Planctomycetaceae bacterium]